MTKNIYKNEALEIQSEQLNKYWPGDLISYLERAEAVRRGVMPGYVDGVIKDTVARHLYRIALFARKNIPLIERMLWVHDLPEVWMVLNSGATNDTTAVAKSLDRKLEILIDKDELMVAGKVLGRSDLELYRRFDEAQRVFKKVKAGIKVDGAAIAARVIDVNDGNLIFHYYVSRWCSEQTDSDVINSWPTAALEYTFSNSNKMIEAMGAFLFDKEEYKKFAIKLIRQKLETVRGFWDLVPEDRIPKALQVAMERWS